MQAAYYNIEDLLQNEPDAALLAEGYSFVEWLQLCEVGKLANLARIKKQQDLINSFIQEERKVQPVKAILNEAIQSNNITVSDDAKIELDDIVTETLAKVYYQQRKYNLAIRTYEKLSLEYPEKSSLFAELINSIRKEREAEQYK